MRIMRIAGRRVLDAPTGLLARTTIAGALALGLIATPAHAELSKVRVATQIGLSYLPLIIMQHDNLWEKKAKEAGLTLSVEYSRLGGGAALNDALLSDSVQMVSGGVAPMLVMWDRTQHNYKVKGVSVISTFPLDFLTNNPRIKSVKDFGPNDRIAVASVKVSYNAILVQMAAEKALGHWDALENIQVSMAHPEAYAALTTHSGGITGYLATPPFQERALEHPGVHKIVDSFEIQGGRTSAGVIYAKSDFIQNNPKIVAAFMAAQKEAVASILAAPKQAIDKYLAVTGDKTDRKLLENILKTYDFDMQPKRTYFVAEFMNKTGLLKTKPKSWKDYFFDTVATGKGS